MTYKIKFGTDGWRGTIAEDYTFDNVRRAAQGYASYMLSQGKQGQWIVVGYDKRFGSENFAAAAAEVLAGNGFKVYLTNDATPTPVIAYAVVDRKAAGAVNITASHNPPPESRKLCVMPGGAIAAIMLHSSTWGLLAKQCAGLKAMVCACCAIAAATRVFPWPMEVTTDEPPEPSM